jgi:putative DNA primase/helicase
MGDYAIAADASLLITNKRQGSATPDLVRLHGRRLVAINETEQNDHLNESRVKFLTSNQTITARDLYESFFDFMPTHKTFMATNYKPIVKGTDEGIWRRIHLLPFVRVIPPEERDPNFRTRVLLPELPGILNWALQGLRQYQEIGLKPPPAVTGATTEYRSDMDLIGMWIEECCRLDPAAEETTSNLHDNYKVWATRNVGFYATIIGFGRNLAQRQGLRAVNIGGHRGFIKVLF